MRRKWFSSKEDTQYTCFVDWEAIQWENWQFTLQSVIF